MTFETVARARSMLAAGSGNCVIADKNGSWRLCVQTGPPADTAARVLSVTVLARC
jgi:hypothetical protein